MPLFRVTGTAATRLERLWRVTGTGAAEEVSRAWRVTASGGVELVFVKGSKREALAKDVLALGHTRFNIVDPMSVGGTPSDTLRLAHEEFVLGRTFEYGPASDTVRLRHARFNVPVDRTGGATDTVRLRHARFRIPVDYVNSPIDTLRLRHARFLVAGQRAGDASDVLRLAHAAFDPDAHRLKTPTNFTVVLEETATVHGPPVVTHSASDAHLSVSVPGIAVGSPGWMFDVQHGDPWQGITAAPDSVTWHIPIQETGRYRVRITGAPSGTVFSRDWSNTVTVLSIIPPQAPGGGNG